MEGFFMGQIILFAGNFAPRGWMFCQGQLLSIAQYEALFAIIGTIYGGDGVQTFALPDLRGRSIIGPGQGPGLSNYFPGEMAGADSVTLQQSQLPAHTHPASMSVPVSTANGTQVTPNGNVPASSVNLHVYAAANTAGGQLGGVSATVSPAGGSQPVDIRAPYLGMNYVICVEGIFPSRN